MTPDVDTLPLSQLAELAAAGANPAARAAAVERLRAASLDGVRVYPESLTWKDGAAFLALDDLNGAGLLLQVGGNARPGGLQAPTQHHALPNGTDCYVYAFGSYDHANIAAFAHNLAPEFLPRPQGRQPAIAAGNRHPEVSLPAVFDAFAGILRETGRNLASTVQLSATREMTTEDALDRRDGSNPTAIGHTRVSIRHLYHCGLWAAIRAGFREGYSAEADHFIVSGNNDGEIAESLERVHEAIRHAAGYTKFTTDTSRLFDLRADERHPQAMTAQEIEERFHQILTADEQAWLFQTFARPFTTAHQEYRLSQAELKRLAVKFVPSLRLNEELYDAIRTVKAGAPFDFEPSLDEADTLTTPQELIFYMHWLAERGRPAQLVPPNLGFKKRQAYPDTMERLERYVHHKMWPEVLPRAQGEFGGDPVAELKDRIRSLADIAARFDGTLSIHSGSGKQPEVLRAIGQATNGRLNYKISGELQLQLLDVLSEQPAGSEGRGLYDRMVAACEAFAAQSAFGEESEMAAGQRSARGAYLGDATGGRTDGNLFLVFWLGNLVGSKDTDGVFFKTKLDQLPAGLLTEVRRRNTNYVKWLASHLFA